MCHMCFFPGFTNRVKNPYSRFTSPAWKSLPIGLHGDTVLSVSFEY